MAVDICTSNDAHFKVAMAAVEAGKPFNLEKPITLTAEEADILAKAAQEKNVKNMVCFSLPIQGCCPLCQGSDCAGQDRACLSREYAVFSGVGIAPCQLPLSVALCQEQNRYRCSGRSGKPCLGFGTICDEQKNIHVLWDIPVLTYTSVRCWTAKAPEKWMWTISAIIWRIWRRGSLSASDYPGLPMAAVTISVWRFTVVRVPLSTAWMPHLPELTKLKSAPEISMPMPMFSTICHSAAVFLRSDAVLCRHCEWHR